MKLSNFPAIDRGGEYQRGSKWRERDTATCEGLEPRFLRLSVSRTTARVVNCKVCGNRRLKGQQYCDSHYDEER